MPGVDQKEALTLATASDALSTAQDVNGFVQLHAPVAESYEEPSDLLKEIYSKREEDSLIFEDSNIKNGMFRRLQTMRQNQEFTDVILQVGRSELFAHKVVLAAASPYLYELFSSETTEHDQYSCQGNEGPNQPIENGHGLANGHHRSPKNIVHQIPRYDFRQFPPEEFELLISYAYTSKLIASPHQVKTVYRIATQLRLKRVAYAAASYLAKRLCVDNAIALRACANSSRDIYLTEEVDSFIQQNFQGLAENSTEFAALPCIQAELTVPFNQSLPKAPRLCERVLQQIERCSGVVSGDVSPSIEPLANGNSRTFHFKWEETSDVVDAEACGGGGARDERSRSTRSHERLSADVTSKRRLSQSPSREEEFDRGSAESVFSEDEINYRMIAAQKLTDSTYLALVVADCKLSSLSVRVARPRPSPDELYEMRRSMSVEERCLARMNDRRCSAGVVTIEGKIVACGGYDRGRCLDSVEAYDPTTNVWTCLLPMSTRRARLSAVVWNDKILAVYGSDGANDLASIEAYDPLKSAWGHVTDGPLGRSDLAACILGDKLYVIGGWNGQTVFKNVDVFDLITGTWAPVAPLPDGRMCAACVTDGSRLLLVGGSNRYGCVNTVLSYDPFRDVWSELTRFSVARRGCGAAVVGGKLLVIGGADGTNSLNSVEVLDLTTNQWSLGPSLNVARTNVEMAVLTTTPDGGVTVYAVGGFSGKSFLNSMEMLKSGSEEWHYRFE